MRPLPIAASSLILVSDQHSPARFRVNGPMIDTPSFAATYQCAAGTPMNDGKACVVW
jgi:predicted metalloendopeptidase